MNGITCEVIRDLLPLYAEGEASTDSNALVEQHLAQCPSCAAKLEELKAPLLVPVETEQRIMERMKRKRRRKKVRSVMAIVLALLLLIGLPLLSVWLDMSVKLDASDITVETLQNGQTRLQLSDKAKGGILSAIYTQDEEGNTTMYLSLTNNPRLIKLAGRLLSLQSSDEFYTRDILLDVYDITWTITDGAVTGMQYNGFWSSVGFCDSVILGDSVTTVYFQPGIETETTAFSSYMEGLIDATFSETSLSGTSWTKEQLDARIRSQYEVPESEERVLIWSE
ncbi:MAG: zf-HC2 domain-containing protein [Lachnospiraceae bacterium]|nr:zf-HC2 domain-containing protein [Lachnospiraceae bacterium]